MARRLCLDCGALCDSTRCPNCRRGRQRQIDQQRGSREARGYGTAHRAARARLLPLALGTQCPIAGPNCDGIMTDPNRMDLDHSDPASRLRGAPGDRMTCSTCNRRDGGKRS